MSWLIVVLAGLFEIAWTVGLKLNVGFSRPFLVIGTVLAIFLSMGLLAFAMREIPMGTAYAAWTGIGIVGAFVVGIAFFEEPATPFRIISVLLVLIGLVGLKLSSQH